MRGFRRGSMMTPVRGVVGLLANKDSPRHRQVRSFVGKPRATGARLVCVMRDVQLWMPFAGYSIVLGLLVVLLFDLLLG